MVERGLKIGEIMELSPRQIKEIYFHERDDKGKLVLPAERTEVATVDRLRTLLSLIESGRVKASAEALEELRGRIRRHSS